MPIYDRAASVRARGGDLSNPWMGQAGLSIGRFGMSPALLTAVQQPTRKLHTYSFERKQARALETIVGLERFLTVVRQMRRSTHGVLTRLDYPVGECNHATDDSRLSGRGYATIPNPRAALLVASVNFVRMGGELASPTGRRHLDRPNHRGPLGRDGTTLRIPGRWNVEYLLWRASWRLVKTAYRLVRKVASMLKRYRLRASLIGLIVNDQGV